ncbi:MAG: DNA internalization-related competence protein ComEC/Rec2 [Oscillospiraceae bacterium]|nr:DNA internalization-related competence protein ComEC/Rec2 [Oscillospiraceae bacterium]
MGMRVLATLAFSFACGVGLSVLLPWDGWQLWAACALAGAGLVLAAAGKRLCFRKRLLLIVFAVSAALLYVSAYTALVCRPWTEQCGQTAAFTATAVEYAVENEHGARITVRLGPGAKAVLYGDETLLTVEPGQRLSGTARWQNAGRVHETDIATFTSRGVFVLLYQKGTLQVEQGEAGSLLYVPQRFARSTKEIISRVWDDALAGGVVLAELTGDRTGISPEIGAAISQAGLSHLFAVSGLHCAFLVALVHLLLRRRKRWLTCAVAMIVLVFYAAMVGFTASVVRACVLQFFLLLAPLARRDADPLTALAAALWLLLMLNPYAVGGVGLQLSFAATLGMILFAEKLYERFTSIYRGKRRAVRQILSFFAANLSATASALLFTVPLTAYYFNVFTLIAPVSNLLVLPIASWNFSAAVVTVLLGHVFLPAARAVGIVCYLLTHAMVWLAGALASLPFHALYFSNVYLRLWLPYVYLMGAGCAVLKAKRRAVAGACAAAVLTLVLAVAMNGAQFRSGTMTAMAVDVGQGECVILASGDRAVVVDCGSSNSYVSAGDRAADELNGVGIRRLSALVLTHFHADHANGVEVLMARVGVEELWIPDIEDEFGMRERLMTLAQKKGIRVRLIESVSTLPLGEAVLTAYPPVGAGDMNEQGLTVLCSAGDFDVLITGDMAGSTERRLIEKYDLPDVEVLVVSHHGSKNSSAREFLDAVRPETALICVGDNSYGHPTEEAMMRLTGAGAVIYRTDVHGNITVKAGKEAGNG